MSEKRFLYRNFLEEEVEKRFTEEYDEEWGIYLSDNLTGDWYNINPVHIVDTCNKLWEQVVKLREENEQLRTQLLICQQSKNDDGRIKVWQVPPIPKEMRITTSTTSDGDIDE